MSTAAYVQPAPSPAHSLINVQRYFGLCVIGALFPLAAGLLFFGFRAGLTVAIVLLAAAGTAYVWRRIGARGGQLRYPHVLWLALVLALMLPAQLSAPLDWNLPAGCCICLLAGALLVIFSWLLGGMGAGRIHPVVVTYLVLTVLFGVQLTPRQVLQRNRLGIGDISNAIPSAQFPFTEDSWLHERIISGHDAIEMTPASVSLGSYTTGQISPDRAWSSLEALLRDRMPPLQDLILGSHPGPIGTACAIAVGIGGLFLLYRGLIDYRVPLLIVLSAFIALLVLPIPWQVTDHPQWRWVIGHVNGVGWPMGVTFANYEIFASPLLFMAFFLATYPGVRPLTRRGRTIYSILIGLLTAVFQLYVSVAFGCYLALLIVSLLTPSLNKWVRPRPLV